MTSDLRDRRIEESADDAPFDHVHYGRWVRMNLARTSETACDGVIRRSRTYICPSCSYELTETEPIALAGSV